MENVIEVNNFTKRFGDLTAVDDLSFNLEKGSTMAFLGANGSGKTTTFRCLLDIYKPTKGSLLINGQPYRKQIKDQIGYLPEERGLYTKVKVIDLLSYILELKGLKGKKAKTMIEEYLDSVDLSEHSHKQISQLSSGMQQKVQLGMVLIHQPPLLILDEPFKGLDPMNRQFFIDKFRDLKENGSTMIYSTHIIDEAERLADKLLIIKEGKKAAEGSIGDVRKSFGSDHIFVEYEGELIQTGSMSKIVYENNGRNAEIIPKKNVAPGKILEEILSTKEVSITKYSTDAPSLNQVFIKINGQEK